MKLIHLMMVARTKPKSNAMNKANRIQNSQKTSVHFQLVMSSTFRAMNANWQFEIKVIGVSHWGHLAKSTQPCTRSLWSSSEQILSPT